MNKIEPIFWFFLSLLTPLFFTLSFPRFNLGYLSWISLVPWLIAIKREGFWVSFFHSWLLGLLSFMGVFFWIRQVDKFTWGYYLLGCLYVGIYFALFSLFSHLVKLERHLAPLFQSSLWVSIEYLRSNFFFLSLPWALMGHTQYTNIPLIQISSITGVYGLSFLVVLVNILIGDLSDWIIVRLEGEREKNIPFFSVSLYVFTPLIILCFCLWGMKLEQKAEITAHKVSANKVRIGLVQGNIPQDLKWKKETLVWSTDLYEKLTREAAAGAPDLIVWPETSLPKNLHFSPRLAWRILALARQTHTPLILGAGGSAKIGRAKGGLKALYNSAFYISAQGTMRGEYKKMRLLPFGELMPSCGRFSLSFLFPGHTMDFTPGKEIKVFPLDKKIFGVTICWENIFPQTFRSFILKGAMFMVNISNDAWFKDSAGPYQHLMCNIFRAVENRVSIARAANTGISCFINPFGRIVEKVEGTSSKDLNIAGTALQELPLLEEKTFYTNYGDIFAFICIAFFGLMAIKRLTLHIF